MKMFVRGSAVGVVLVSAAVGLAIPASAEPPSGAYTATVISSSNPMVGMNGGDTVPATLTPCGPDCTHIQLGARDSFQSDLRLQGNTWTGTRIAGRDGTGGTCTFTLDNSSLVLTDDCPATPSIIQYQLTKNG